MDRRGHLPGVLLPELGAARRALEAADLFEGIRSAFAAGAAQAPLAVVFDDMQWADEATLGLLPAMARALDSEPVLLVVVYREDEVPRGHPIRRLRTELRRDERLTEVPLQPLAGADVAGLLGQALNGTPAPSLVGAVLAHTGGVPLFVTELGAALRAGARLREGDAGLELSQGADLPLPESVRDAVLVRASGVAPDARSLLEVAAVLGNTFEVDLAMAIARVDTWPDDLLDHGLVAEAAPGSMTFRHALVREAFYGEVSWQRRRLLHREVAQRLRANGGSPRIVAEHWVLGGESGAACRSFLSAVDAACAVHAYRDGASAARRALELSADDEPSRLEAFRRLGECAGLAGDAREAARAWREVAEGCSRDQPLRAGDAWHRHAGELEIQGRWEEALAAREAAAVAFSRGGALGDAAAQRLAAAAHLRSAASFRAALRLLNLAAQDASTAARVDLGLRIRALEGNVRARMGDGTTGVELVRGALTDALQADLTSVAAEIYQRLADSLEHRGDYAGARSTYDDAAAFCTTIGADSVATVCLACLAVVLRQVGEWPRASALAREVLEAPSAIPHARAAAGCTLGLVHALQGDVDQARALLLDAGSLSRRIELVAGEVLSAWGLAVLDHVRESSERVIDGCRLILRRCEDTEERHYSVSPLRWATSVLVELGDPEGARACAAALARIAAETGQPEAMSALSHALGETALLDGDVDRAVEQFQRAIDLLREVDAPFELIESERRAAAALVRVARRDDAVDRLLGAYRLARRLRARPSIQRLAASLADLDERVDRRLSRRQAEQLVQEQLTRRELEVVRLLAAGQTNREIAKDLFLSVRTVDMHVRNILRKLDCRSRTEAARRAGELGLLADTAR